MAIDSINRPIILIGTEDRRELIQDIQRNLSLVLVNDIEIELKPHKYFTDGAPNTYLEQSVRGKHVYIVSDPNSDSINEEGFKSSINDRYMYKRALAKAAKDRGAKTVNQIETTLTYGRDEQYDQVGNNTHAKRKANLANVTVSDMINDGIDYGITLDLHNAATFNKSGKTNLVNLGVGRVFEKVMERAGLKKSNTVISGCDQGGYKKIESIAKGLQLPALVTIKSKDYSKDQQVDEIQIYGNIEGKDVVLYDDILDTGGTLCNTIEKIAEGKPRSIHVVITHALLNGKAYERLQALYEDPNIPIIKLYQTNTVRREKTPEYIEHIDTSTIFARTIESIVNEESINENNNKPFPEESIFFEQALGKIENLENGDRILLPQSGARKLKTIEDIRQTIGTKGKEGLQLAKIISRIG